MPVMQDVEVCYSDLAAEESLEISLSSCFYQTA